MHFYYLDTLSTDAEVVVVLLLLYCPLSTIHGVLGQLLLEEK